MYGTFSSFLLLGLCFIPSEVNSESCSLVIENASNGQEVQDICTNELTQEDCFQFSNTFDKSDIPWATGGLSVQKPRFLKISAPTKSLTAALFIKWGSPASELAMDNLEGFYVQLRRIPSPDINAACALFKVNQDTEFLNYTFKAASPLIQEQTEYNVRVYTVPTPRASERDNVHQYVTSNVVVPPSMPKSYPGYWRPTITYTVTPGKIFYCFNFAPVDFNFTFYTVDILKSNHSHDLPFIYAKIPAAKDKQEECREIEVNSTDQYQIRVGVYQDGLNDYCMCFIKDEFRKRCNYKCVPVRTTWFQVTSLPDDPEDAYSTDATTVSSTSDKSTHGNRSSTFEVNEVTKKSSVYKWLGALVGTFSGVGVVLVTIIVIHKKRRCQNEKITNCNKNEISPNMNEKDDIGRVSSRNLYILSADDSPAHMRAVDALASFLKIHCACDVTYPQWSNIHKDGGFPWLVAHITQADVILFIDSPGAKLLLEAHLNKMIYPERKLGPEGDLFSLGLKHVYSEMGNRRVVPTFFHTSSDCKQKLLVSLEYRIPQHLPQLIQAIHNIHAKDQHKYGKCLPLRLDMLQQLNEGITLMSSLNELKEFNCKHPHWVSEQFGVAEKVEEIQLDSPDSAYGSSVTGIKSSVSHQNLASLNPDSTLCYSNPGFLEDTHHSPHKLVTEASSNSQDIPDFVNEANFQRLIHPPDSFSAVTDVSKALNEINVNHGVNFITEKSMLGNSLSDSNVGHQPSSEDFSNIGLNLLPPDSMSDVNSDHISACLAEIREIQFSSE